MSRRGWHRLLPASLALVLGPTRAFAATTWTVVYPERGTDRGFFDATTRSPVGGNVGTTLGEQRRIAFETAVGIWADVITSPIPLTIDASMVELACDADGAVLGQASASSAVALRLADGTQLAYPVALANAIRESDLEEPSNDNPSGAEVIAEFNSVVGNASCLDGLEFYLGLDGKAGDGIDFVGIVLHELAHGLGFSTYLDLETAEPLFPDSPDAFSTHTFDAGLGASWGTLKPSQLLESMKNARHLVWDGAQVTQAAPRYLVKGAPKLTVTPAVAGLTGVLSEHDDGPKLSEHPATGPLVIPTPSSGCARPANASKISGAIALVDPKEACHPLEAVAFMESAGAKAVIAVDPKSTRPPSMIVGILDQQMIPVVSIHREDATLLSEQAVGRTVTLEGDLTRLVGADAQGRVYLNATDPLLQESSISHWDPLARNQLLMEPERSANHRDVDLTREFMRDLGWPTCGDGLLQAAEECDDGNNTDFDGCDANCKRGELQASGAGGGGGVGQGAKGGASDIPIPGATAESGSGAGGEVVGCSCHLSDALARRRDRGIWIGWLIALSMWRTGVYRRKVRGEP